MAAVCGETSEEFWDYEHQVDLEAFSTSTFYSLLLKQSLSVTTRLGRLTAEVRYSQFSILNVHIIIIIIAHNININSRLSLSQGPVVTVPPSPHCWRTHTYRIQILALIGPVV